MQEFIGVKRVKAVAKTIAQFHRDQGLEPGYAGESRPGYEVHYPDGYVSWCPKEQFEAANRPVDGLSFGHAIEAAKKGAKIARRGWNGKNMFVVYMPPLQLPPHSSQEPGAKVNDRTAAHIGVDTPLDCQPYFAMLNAQGQWICGWSATQSDMLSDDWTIVETSD